MSEIRHLEFRRSSLACFIQVQQVPRRSIRRRRSAALVTYSRVRGRRGMGDSHQLSGDSSHTDSDSDEEGTALTVSEAKAMIRDIMTLCGRQPHKKQLAESRARAQGDPQAAMLSVVPMVVNVAEEALARRAKNRQQLVGRASPHGQESPTPSKLKLAARQDSLLVPFLEEVQFLVGADPSGQMKKDLIAFRSLLAPP